MCILYCFLFKIKKEIYNYKLEKIMKIYEVFEKKFFKRHFFAKAEMPKKNFFFDLADNLRVLSEAL